MRSAIFFLFLLFVSSITCQSLIPKQKKKKWGFVNSQGEWIIKAKYSEVNPFKENLACVRIKKKWGFINLKGKKVIPFQFSAAKSFKNGRAAVRSLSTLSGNTRESNNKYKWRYIDYSGVLKVPYLFKTVNEFDKENRANVQLFEMKKNEFFWINPDGKAISPPFTKAEKINLTYKLQNIRNDGAKVYSFINPDGSKITDWYLNDFNLNKDTIKVWLPSKIENDTIEEEAFKGNIKKKLCAFIDKKGEVLSDWYSEIKPFNNGFAPIRHNHLYGFIDDNYNLVKKPTYRELALIENKIYKGQIEYGRTALLDYKGKEISHYCFDFKEFQEGYFLGEHQLKSSYRNENKYAVFDLKGNQKTSWYNKINPIHNGVVRVIDERTTRSKSGTSYSSYYNYVLMESGELISSWRPVIKTTWKDLKKKEDSILTKLFLSSPIHYLDLPFFKKMFVKEFEFDENDKSMIFSGGDFHNGMALVAKKGKDITIEKNGIKFSLPQIDYGYIDWYGDLVITYKFKEAAAFRDGYAVVGNGSDYGTINHKGKKVIPYQNLLLGAYGSGLFPFLDEEGRWGYINRKNRIQIKPEFDQALPYSYGYASVKKGRFWGLIDVMGNEVMHINYNKSIEVISPLRIRYLKSGVGYVESTIDEIKKQNTNP